MANPKDFLHPVAAYDDASVSKYTLVNKYLGKLWTAEMHHSPFNVVAWTGNYCPFKYDLRKFNTMNTVSFDHPVGIFIYFCGD